MFPFKLLWHSRQDSNLYSRFRGPVHYPLCYESIVQQSIGFLQYLCGPLVTFCIRCIDTADCRIVPVRCHKSNSCNLYSTSSTLCKVNYFSYGFCSLYNALPDFVNFCTKKVLDKGLDKCYNNNIFSFSPFSFLSKVTLQL